ncbi:MAG: CHASE3 domain-containing protein [Verrucomicrobiales bacterium]|nr:CHASE3 domain-containing protein [Verrucomicrobiales bacterium]
MLPSCFPRIEPRNCQVDLQLWTLRTSGTSFRRPSGAPTPPEDDHRVYRQPNNSIYKTVVVVWLTLSVASVLLATVTWLDLSRKLEAARVAAQIDEELMEILHVAVDVETGQRGFTISGQDSFLEPMKDAEVRVLNHFGKLLELARHDELMLRRVVELRAQVEACLIYHRDAVELRRKEGLEASARLVARGRGKTIMDEIRSRVSVLRHMRSDVVSEQGAMGRARLVRAIMTSLVAGLLGVVAGVYALWLAKVMLRHQLRERKLVEERLHAERKSHEKSVFLANMSHEIRTPMNAILGFSELLASEIIEPRQRQYLRAIRSSAHSLLQLINDILDMSKIEAGVMELRLEPTDPREICDFLHTVFSEPAAKKGIRFECQVVGDLPNALLMDRIRLRQILVNLVGNAVKFTDTGEIQVRVDWEKQESSSHVTLLIEVDDTGVGIPTDKLEAIFKPFVQAGAFVEKEKSGTGLGLAIVQRLTENMGGTITAASILGQGSAFSLRFPNVPISARLPTAEKLETGDPVNFNDFAPAILLVVDDNETNRQLVAGLFAGSHHHLHFGSDGREAVDLAKQVRPDIILLDVRMPVMGGRDALQAIRQIPGLEVTPILAVTASSLMDEEKDLRQRFNGYIRKPFTRRQLYDELMQFLRPRSSGEVSGADTPTLHDGLPVADELKVELDRLRETVWPELRDSVAVNESRAFADQLMDLAKRWQCDPLADYALQLKRYADDYAVVELEHHLSGFGPWVDQLRTSSS